MPACGCDFHDRPHNVSGVGGGAEHAQRRSTAVKLMSDKGPTFESAHCDQADTPAGKLQHLERLGELNELYYVVGKDLLGTNGVIDGKALWREHRRIIKVGG